MTSSEQDSTIAEGLALAATMCFEMGDQTDEARVKVVALWEQVGSPTGAFRAAAATIAHLPQPDLESAELTERNRGGGEEFGAPTPEQQLDATLKARELLQGLANEQG